VVFARSQPANGKATLGQQPKTKVGSQNIRSLSTKAISRSAMTLTSLCTIGFIAGAALAGLTRLAPIVLQDAGQAAPAVATSPDASKGVHCPNEFEARFDAVNKVLRCRRETVAWAVTSCPDKDFATYTAKPGPDSCGRTEIPGVGTPPGATTSRPVTCASTGYAIVQDRTGHRDRCERVDQVFVYPRPVS